MAVNPYDPPRYFVDSTRRWTLPRCIAASSVVLCSLLVMSNAFIAGSQWWQFVFGESRPWLIDHPKPLLIAISAGFVLPVVLFVPTHCVLRRSKTYSDPLATTTLLSLAETTATLAWSSAFLTLFMFFVIFCASVAP